MRLMTLLGVLLWCAACDDGGPSSDAAAATIDAAPPTVDAAADDIDAAPGAPDAAPVVGVDCNGTLCEPLTTAGCCHHPDTMQSCLPIGKVACDGMLYGCDGREDCLTAGDFCCDYTYAVGCGATCTGAGISYVCHGDWDCPVDLPMCCGGKCQDGACP